MKVGVVGNGTDKFTDLGKLRAKQEIRRILSDPEVTAVVSGHSPMGGVDIWAEESGQEFNLEQRIKIPLVHSWDGGYGYKARNIDIARDSDILYVVVANVYPDEYKGRRFKICYHCETSTHVKSGACWTAKQARKLGKNVVTIIITNY